MMRFQMKFVLCLFLMMQACQLSAQSYREHMRAGNRLYRDSAYTDAEVDFRKAVELNPRYPLARYNLANTLLFQQKPKDAMKEYEQAVKLETNKARLADTYHNMGVILQSQRQYGPAIECYKNALRRDPSDDESRYNLVLCQHLLKNNPQDQEKNQDKENKNGDGQNKEEDQNSDKQDQDEKKDQNKEQNKQQQQNPQQQQQNEMSRENAEQLLKAAMQDEKSTQDKVKKAMQQPQRRRLEKQW